MTPPRLVRGDTPRTGETHLPHAYTNAVPQFGTFNSGAWNKAEKEVVTWARQNCVKHSGEQTKNPRIYIVVGAIPSTHQGSDPRFFGESGFSDYQSWSLRQKTYGANTGKKEYRVNVPYSMWTAVCCTFQFLDGKGQVQNGVRSKTSYRGNEPRSGPVIGGLFTILFPQSQLVNIFPKNDDCKKYNQWASHWFCLFWFHAISVAVVSTWSHDVTTAPSVVRGKDCIVPSLR